MASERQGARRVSPYFVPRICANMTAGLIGIMHGFEGPNLCHVTACSSGANAIADAYRLIVDHAVDLMVVRQRQRQCQPPPARTHDSRLAGRRFRIVYLPADGGWILTVRKIAGPACHSLTLTLTRSSST